MSAEKGEATLLLVEDVEDNRGIIRQLARRIGCTLLEAGDGEEGIALARAAQPALILMDLSLPVLDGWAATRRLKADPATAAIPVIALTAHAMAGDRERALACGMDGYVTKPVDLSELQAILKRYLLKEAPS